VSRPIGISLIARARELDRRLDELVRDTTDLTAEDCRTLAQVLEAHARRLNRRAFHKLAADLAEKRRLI